MSLAEPLQQSRLTILPNRLYEITQPDQFSQLSLANVNFHLPEQLEIDQNIFRSSRATQNIIFPGVC